MTTPLSVRLSLSASLRILHFQSHLHQTGFGSLLGCAQVQGHQTWKHVSWSVHDLALMKFAVSHALSPSSWVEPRSFDVEKSCGERMAHELHC